MSEFNAKITSEADLVRQNMELRQRLALLEKEMAAAGEGQEGRERQLAQELALHRVREEVRSMREPDDIEKVLKVLQEELEKLEVLFSALGINVVDTQDKSPSIRTRNMTRNGEGWVPMPERGREIVLRIWEEGKTAYRRDLLTEDLYQERDNLEKSFGQVVRSLLDVPIAQGTLALNSVEPDAFSAADIDFMEDLAAVLSEGLQRQEDMLELTRQKEMLEEKNRLLEAFQLIGQSTLSHLDMDSILDDLAAQIVQAGFFRSLMIALVDRERGIVEVVRNFIRLNEDNQPEMSGELKNQAETIRWNPETRVDQVIQDEKIVGTVHALSDDTFYTVIAANTGEMIVEGGYGHHLTEKPENAKLTKKVAYFIPVKKEGQVLAVLATGSQPEEEEVMRRRIEAMQPLLDQVAIALDHARLYRILGEERERLAVTLRSIGDGVITTDSQGKIELLNEVAETLTGWKQKEAEGHHLMEIFCHSRGGKPGGNPIEETLRENGMAALTRPSLLMARDGTERLIRSSSGPIRDDDGQIAGGVLVVRDITEQQRMEEELNKAQRIESLGLLAGGIAHDFNNILASALVNVSVLKMQLGQRSESLQIIRDIETSVGHARNLTQQLLAFTKGAVPSRSVASLADLVRDSANFSLRGSNVLYECVIAEELWPVDVDPGQINQVIQNLILNAVQAMPDGGMIRISLENITVGTDELIPLEEGRYVKCCIADQGGGIPEEHIDKIFDPYFTSKEQGNGLGLASAYSIVNNHGGWITVESQVGKGAIFFVYLPASQAEIEERLPCEERMVEGQGRVLLMDDDDQLREAVGRALGHLGYDMGYARSGEEALELYAGNRERGKPFDVVVLDLTVPGGMGGKEAGVKLLELDPQARVIVSSGYTNSPVLDHCQRYGFRGRIVKPYTVEDLALALNQVIVPD